LHPVACVKSDDGFFSVSEREREKKIGGGGGSERHYRFGGGCNRNIIWQFGRFPGIAR
jgi:hypothetical protein